MLILASQSPIRKALLSGAGLAFEVAPPRVNERELERDLVGDGPQALAEGLACAKALGVSGATVIGADQVLAFDGALLHKPSSLEAARTQLQSLRGQTHRLHAGVALARDGLIVWSTVETAELTMRAFSDAELDRILAAEGTAILKSVGGYRLEGPSIQLFSCIEGDYFTVLGLPMLPLLAALRLHAPDVF